MVARPTASALTLKTLDGQTLRVADFHGKVVLLDFMASWCRPCEKLVPHYQALQARHSGQLQVIFVSGDDDEAELRPFVQRLKIAGPVGVDVGEKWMKAYRVHALPTAVLIDREGRVFGVLDGSSEADFSARVDRELGKLLAE